MLNFLFSNWTFNYFIRTFETLESFVKKMSTQLIAILNILKRKVPYWVPSGGLWFFEWSDQLLEIF